MSNPLVRRFLVLMLAVLVTVGMGMSAVQASTLSMHPMGMAVDMAMIGPAKCSGCGTSGNSKGMVGCTAPACAEQAAAEAPLVLAFDLVFVPIRHHLLSHTLLGHDTVPDPYPPRTSDIG